MTQTRIEVPRGRTFFSKFTICERFIKDPQIPRKRHDIETQGSLTRYRASSWLIRLTEILGLFDQLDEGDL